jgi:pSer/pThr/pTyr-binding forkhead associated (FHA) protein
MNKVFISYKTRPVKEISLEHGELTIGRASDNHIQINDPKVSAHHAKLVTIFNASHIEDLKSTNGTLVNNRKIVEHTLHDGDRITLGEYNITFSTDSPMEDSESQKTMMMDSSELEKMMEELDKPNMPDAKSFMASSTPEVVTHIKPKPAVEKEVPVIEKPVIAEKKPEPAQAPTPPVVSKPAVNRPAPVQKVAVRASTTPGQTATKNEPSEKEDKLSRLEMLEDSDSLNPAWWIVIIIAILASLAALGSLFL